MCLPCRSAGTSRYYGSTVDLLWRYAWYKDNAHDRTWPAGQKKPNDLGLFDMHGNVWDMVPGRAPGAPRMGRPRGRLGTKKILEIFQIV